MTEQELFRRIELKRQFIELTEIEIKQMEAMLKIKTGDRVIDPEKTDS
jgi:hypothetical protein